jgi:hypothetical protein
MRVFQQQGNVGLSKMMGVCLRHSKFYEKRGKEAGCTVTRSSTHSFFTGTLELFSCSPQVPEIYSVICRVPSGISSDSRHNCVNYILRTTKISDILCAKGILFINNPQKYPNGERSGVCR